MLVAMAAPGMHEAPDPRPRHCWVTGMPHQVDPFPAVLLGWRQDDHGTWWGRVAYSVPGYFEQNIVHAWVDARYLRPLSPPPTPPAVERRRNPH
jgi:hypothetical protein